MDHQRQLARGMLWLGSASLVARVVDALSLIVVLGFLSREELGVATLAWSVTTFLESMNGFGINASVIQRRDLSAEEAAGAHWYATAIGVLLTAIVFVIAPLFASFYSAPDLTPMTRVAGTKLLFVGLANVPLARLSRDMRFGMLGAISTVATLLAAALSIVLATTGFGAWAPLLANTAHGLFQLLGVMWVAPFFPRPTLSLSKLRPLIDNGLHVAGGSVLGQVTRNLDYFVVGQLAGLATLGTYRVAFDLAMAPMVAILQVIGRSALPVYSRLAAEPKELVRAFGWTLRSLSLLVIAPILLVFVAGESVFVLLSKGVEPYTVPVLRVLCVAALLRAVSQPFSQVLVAMGHGRRSLLEALSSTVLVALGMALSVLLLEPLPVAVRVALGWLGAYVIQLGVDVALTRDLLPHVTRVMARALAAPLAVAGTVGAALLVASTLLEFEDPRWAAASHALLLVVLYLLGTRFIAGVRYRRSGARPAAGEATDAVDASP